MAIFQRVQNAMQFVWEGASRIFAPDGDAYPATGIQPYEGDPYDEERSSELTRI